MIAIALLISIRLTNQIGAMPSTRISTYPTLYPKDSNNKVEVLERSIASIGSLPISDIFYYIEIDSDIQYSESRFEVLLRTIFKSATIHALTNRPTTKQSWLMVVDRLEKEISDTKPIVLILNHDHIFVDTDPRMFLQTLLYLCTNNQNHYLIYSHAPECVSLALNFDALNFRQSHYNGGTFPRSRPVEITKELYGMHALHIDGVFATTLSGMRYLWENTIVTTEYAPRPDWPGVQIGAPLKVFFSTREFFRHFDGYGHITRLPSMLGLSLARLQNSCSTYSKEYSDDLMLDFRVNLFESVYLLSIRDYIYHQLYKKETIEYFDQLQMHIDSFLRAYPLPPSSTTPMSLCNKQFADIIHAKSNIWFQLCYADCLMVPPRS
jgi:hypothetical protein